MMQFCNWRIFVYFRLQRALIIAIDVTTNEEFRGNIRKISRKISVAAIYILQLQTRRLFAAPVFATCNTFVLKNRFKQINMVMDLLKCIRCNLSV